MAWRTMATVLIVIFAATMTWIVVADPLVEVGDHFKVADETDSNDLDPSGQIDSNISAFFNMFLILIFGVMAWGAWRVLRNEITRGGGGGL